MNNIETGIEAGLRRLRGRKIYLKMWEIFRFTERIRLILKNSSYGKHYGLCN